MSQTAHVGCLNDHYGSVLKRLREVRGISQEELAFRTGLDRTYVSMLERNRRLPSLATVEKISAALAMKPSRFIKMVEDACDCKAKESNQNSQVTPVHKAKYEFSSRADEKAEVYLVRMEEVGEGAYVVRYGLAPSLLVYPLAGATMMSLEAVQFLGRLWGTGHIPEALRKDYKAWLTKLEFELINQHDEKSQN